jgi:hypothetical protein
MSISAKQAAIEIRTHLVLRQERLQTCIYYAEMHCKADPQLGVKLTAAKTAIEDAISYIDSRVKNG